MAQREESISENTIEDKEIKKNRWKLMESFMKRANVQVTEA